MTDPDVFNQNIATWQKEQDQPWMGLRYRLELQNILAYAREEDLRILDAGGGNGALAMALGEAGHHVSIVDFSNEMLSAAMTTIEEKGLQTRVHLFQADLADIPDLFPVDSFDLVLCHNVIQYTPDPQAALTAVQTPLRPSGTLSVVSMNKYAEVYKAAFREEDLSRAHEQLTASETRATLFDHPIKYFTDQEMIAMLAGRGFENILLYGIRCINDWLPNAPKYRPEFMAQLEALEVRLSQNYPYYLLARFFQVIGKKPRHGP